MATTTIDNTTVVFSNSTAAANLSASISESASSYVYNFDVLAYSGGGAKTTLWSVDDGVKGDDNPAVVVSSAFSGYNTDLLYKDAANSWETSSLGAKFAIVNGKIQYDASGLSGQINHLGVGESLNDTLQYTIRMSNGTLSVGTLKVALTGTNDAVVITSGAQGATTNEDANAASTGSISFSDADTNDTHSASATAAATNTTALGSFSVGTVSETHVPGNDALGSVGWSYTVDNAAANYLGRTESATETYNVKVADGHGGDAVQAVTVTIQGVNDAVSIVAGSTTATGSADEDASNDVTGSIAFTDPDYTDTHTTGVAAHGDNAGVGAFALGAVSEDGSTAGGSVGWTYTVDNAAANHLGVGESAVDRFDVTIGDGLTSATQTVEVTVTGVNDDVAITSAVGGATTDEDATNASTGTIAFTDPDYTDTHEASAAADESNATELGAFVLGTVSESATDADGSVGWTYTVDNDAAAYLRAGEHATEVYNVTIKDAHGSEATQAVTVRIDGVNDAATIGAGANSDNSVRETGATVAGDLTAGGHLAIADLDHDEAVLKSASTGNFVKTYGTFHVAADGTWSYDLNDAAADSLVDGDVRHDTLTVTSFDGGTDYVIDVTINGSNDVVPFTAPTTAAVSTGGGDVSDNDGAVGGAGTAGTLTGDANPNNLLGNNTSQTINGLGGADTLTARGGDDIVNGGDGNDTIYGGSGDDQLNGGNDNDLIYGSSNNDKINGDAGNDVLLGGSGTDTITGGDGNDSITGGKGADLLTGGNNDDTFYYLSLADVGDHITDFKNPGADKIDVSAIDSGAVGGAFAWGGADTATAHGIWWHTDGTNTTIYGDTDGVTTTAEFWVVLDNVTSVAQTDFVL